jgi:hypothetical protein
LLRHRNHLPSPLPRKYIKDKYIIQGIERLKKEKKKREKHEAEEKSFRLPLTLPSTLTRDGEHELSFSTPFRREEKFVLKLYDFVFFSASPFTLANLFLCFIMRNH